MLEWLEVRLDVGIIIIITIKVLIFVDVQL